MNCWGLHTGRYGWSVAMIPPAIAAANGGLLLQPQRALGASRDTSHRRPSNAGKLGSRRSVEVEVLRGELGRQAPLRRLNSVCPYFTMFPLEFPLEALAGAEPGTWCLDPFCGRGTTLYAARLLGLNAVGVDVNQVATALAAAKLVYVRPQKAITLASRLLCEVDPTDVPSGEFWDHAYAPKTLVDLCRLREGLIPATSPSAVALRALVLGVLHGPVHRGEPGYLSNQMPRTYATKPAAAVRFWRTRSLIPPETDVLGVISRRAGYTLAKLPPRVRGRVICGDARTVVSGVQERFSRVVTSPPYYGMRTYLPDQWLRNWFLGGSASVDHRFTGQLPQASPAAFTAELAQVWSKVAEKCVPGVELWVRFGSLPSRTTDAADIIGTSLWQGGWDVVDVVDAGAPPVARRQANQFKLALPVSGEIDCRAVLRPIGR